MDASIKKGPLPRRLSPKLEQRDTRPLPSEALLRLQKISRGKNPSNNYRWVLFYDGRVFHDYHEGDESDWSSPFNDDLAAEATEKLGTETVNNVEEWLRQENFLEEPPFQVDENIRGGDYYIVTARLAGQIHEVIYAAVFPPLIDNLWTLVYHEAD